MPNTVPHRATANEDWSGLLALIRRAFAGMDGRIDPPSSLTRLTAQDIRRQSETGEVWVIGQPAIACVFLTPRSSTLYVGKLAVDPAAQRQGHGRALIALAEQRAKALGLAALELQTRLELVENQATFRALGFVETGRTAHEGYDRPTSVTFTKAFAPGR